VNGEDLTGGYFTQGTTATFVFPNAAATTILAWSMLDFEDAYQATGEIHQFTLS
jgi:endoglucanase